jgi:hypothetical protein
MRFLVCLKWSGFVAASCCSWYLPVKRHFLCPRLSIIEEYFGVSRPVVSSEIILSSVAGKGLLRSVGWLQRAMLDQREVRMRPPMSDTMVE